jgi:Bacterial capsule synthesis protein PGA_cap
MSRAELTLLATGDLILPERDSDWLFDGTRQVLQSADVVVGHVEPFNTPRGHHATAEPGTGYTPRDPRILGFHMATMAHNRTYEGGPAAIEDTRDALLANGMLTTGAGMNLDAARTPAILERDGVRFGFLSYNNIIPAYISLVVATSVPGAKLVLYQDHSHTLAREAAERLVDEVTLFLKEIGSPIQGDGRNAYNH